MAILVECSRTFTIRRSNFGTFLLRRFDVICTRMSFIALRCRDPQCELSGDSPARTVGVERNGWSVWSEPERLRVEKYVHYIVVECTA